MRVGALCMNFGLYRNDTKNEALYRGVYTLSTKKVALKHAKHRFDGVDNDMEVRSKIELVSEKNLAEFDVLK